MRTLTLTTEVRGQVGEVFDVLTDLRGYDSWLDSSAEYTGTVDISDGEIREGTTYVEHSRVGVRRDRVTELRAPEHVVFHQPMHLRPALAGVIDIVVTYTLRQDDVKVHIERTVQVGLPWSLRLAAPLVLGPLPPGGRPYAASAEGFRGEGVSCARMSAGPCER